MFLIPDSWYKIKIVKHKGRGAFAARDIPAGTVIGDYIGKIIECDGNSEEQGGLYDMAGGEKYDILADPKVKGVHFLNHSCANNCDVYPYKGHMLFFASRKIFKGEELSLNYWLYAPDEKKITCDTHACYCKSKFCQGTMHDAASNFDEWDAFIKKQFGPAFRTVPGKYGEQLLPLESYPSFIENPPYPYDTFGSEAKPTLANKETTLPSLRELRKRLRDTGRRLSFPKIGIVVDGIRHNVLVAEATK